MIQKGCISKCSLFVSSSNIHSVCNKPVTKPESLGFFYDMNGHTCTMFADRILLISFWNGAVYMSYNMCKERSDPTIFIQPQRVQSVVFTMASSCFTLNIVKFITTLYLHTVLIFVVSSFGQRSSLWRHGLIKLLEEGCLYSIGYTNIHACSLSNCQSHLDLMSFSRFLTWFPFWPKTTNYNCSSDIEIVNHELYICRANSCLCVK